MSRKARTSLQDRLINDGVASETAKVAAAVYEAAIQETDEQKIGLSANSHVETEIAVKFYESARAEIIQRILVRDQVLMFYIASIGAYLAFVYNQASSININLCGDLTGVVRHLSLLLPVPFVCFVFTNIVLQHHLVINNLGRYLGIEWRKNLKPGVFSMHWDESLALDASRRQVHTYRSLGQAAILIVPSAYDILELYRVYDICGIHQKWLYCAFMTSAIIVAALMIYIGLLHWLAHRARIQLFEDIRKEKSKAGYPSG